MEMVGQTPDTTPSVGFNSQQRKHNRENESSPDNFDNSKKMGILLSILSAINLKELCIVKWVYSCLYPPVKENKLFEEDEGEEKTIRPCSLLQLTEQTNYSRAELQAMYRGFKQECPSGTVTLIGFRRIYKQLFPLGDTERYANQIFNSLDNESKGVLTFNEFVGTLSMLSRGTLVEKLRWTFHLYDVDQDGQINRDNMTDIIQAMYDMMGKYTEPLYCSETIEEHVNDVFERIDKDKKGYLTEDEFVNTCLQDEQIRYSATALNTTL